MTNKMTLPAGQYWIGDPCYVFPHDGPMETKWDELLEACNFFDNSAFVEIDDGKIKVWAANTAYGDGRYEGSNGHQYPVDAGLIGIVPKESVEYLSRTDNDLEYLGTFVEFDESFIVESDNGYFRFGNITIDTGDYACDEDEYDDYDE